MGTSTTLSPVIQHYMNSQLAGRSLMPGRMHLAQRALTWGKRGWRYFREGALLGVAGVEHGNCQHLLALSHITPPCCVPPTGCSEKLTGLVAASHAQHCHHCATTWLPPSLSNAYGDRSDFHCVLVSLTPCQASTACCRPGTHGRFTLSSRKGLDQHL